jgi:hypothetical protein
MVFLPIIENQIESVFNTVTIYLPAESVMPPLPEVERTATASNGLRAVKS